MRSLGTSHVLKNQLKEIWVQETILEHIPQNEIFTPKCNPKSSIFYGQTLIKFILYQNLYPNRVILPQFRPNLPKFLKISKLGALLEHVIKYTQYSPNLSLTETLTRSNSPVQSKIYGAQAVLG